MYRSVKKREGENFPVMLSWPPARTGARKLTQIALTWNSGRTRSAWSAAVSDSSSYIVAAR